MKNRSHWGEVTYKRGGVNERSQEGEYGWYASYTRMNVEFFKPVEITIRKGLRQKREK
jgi:hypothetical protein